MSIYLKSEIKDRKRIRKCQVAFTILTIICAIWTLINPSAILTLLVIVSLSDVWVGQLYLDKMTIWDLQDQIGK